MKKTIFNANFEESKKIVTKQYIFDSYEARTTRRYRKYPLGYLLMDLIAAAVCIIAIYVFEEALNIRISQYFPYGKTFFIVLALFYALYIGILFKERSKKLLSHYHLNCMCAITMPIVCVEFLLASIMAPVFVTGILLIGVVWFVVDCIVIVWFVNKERNNLLLSLYGTERANNVFYQFIEKFVAFARKYGWIIILLSAIGRRFFGFKTETITVSDGTKRGLADYIFAMLAPLMPLVAFMFTVAIAEHHLQGFYLAKYYEEYRLHYGFTEEEWYQGEISPERFEQLEAEAAEEQKNRGNIRRNLKEMFKKKKEK